MNKSVREKTFSQKYELYGLMLYRLAMVFLGSSPDAEDALQEVFIRLLYRAPAFTDAEHEKRWLLRVCINECKNRLSSASRKKRAPLGEHPSCETSESGEVLEEGYGVDETARILGVGTSAVKMRLSRAREMLRMDLEDET